MLKIPGRFNLVIENLIVSSHGMAFDGTHIHMFQSRNRESYCFKADKVGTVPTLDTPFQSRNRESYCFKT